MLASGRMSPTLTLVLVIVFAFVTSRWLSELASRRFIPSGAEFVVIGLAVGPLGLGVASADSIAALQPVASLLLGILGFALGLSLRRELTGVAILPRVAAGVLVGLVVAVATCALLWALAGLPSGPLPPEVLWPAVAFASMAMVSSEWTMPIAIRLLRSHGPATRFLAGIPAVFNAVAVLLFGLTVSAVRAAYDGDAATQLTVTEWAVVSALGGCASGLLFYLFIGHERDPRRIYLASIGSVFVASGIAAGGGLSPIFVNLIAGAACAALTDEAVEVRRVLSRLLTPIYAVVLVLAGAMWTPVAGAAWLVLPLYLLVRVGALRMGVGVLLRMTDEVPVRRRLGDGLTAQGGFAVALALNFAQLVPEEAALVLTVGLGALVITDLASARAIHRVLADAGEVDAEAPDATGLDEGEPCRS